VLYGGIESNGVASAIMKIGISEKKWRRKRLESGENGVSGIAAKISGENDLAALASINDDKAAWRNQRRRRMEEKRRK
jgi:hypothetical protein